MQVKELVGEKVFIRTVTYHLVGEIVDTMGEETGALFFVLEDASWVADSGRFMSAIKDGTLNEVEPVGTAYVNADSITDMFPWTHELPSRQK